MTKLCCITKPMHYCRNCKDIRLCTDHGRPYVERDNHFIVDMCRKRFTRKEIIAASKCYKKRLTTDTFVSSITGKPQKRLSETFGDCLVCEAYQQGLIDRHPGGIDFRNYPVPEKILNDLRKKKKKWK